MEAFVETDPPEQANVCVKKDFMDPRAPTSAKIVAPTEIVTTVRSVMERVDASLDILDPHVLSRARIAESTDCAMTDLPEVEIAFVRMVSMAPRVVLHALIAITDFVMTVAKATELVLAIPDFSEVIVPGSVPLALATEFALTARHGPEVAFVKPDIPERIVKKRALAHQAAEVARPTEAARVFPDFLARIAHRLAPRVPLPPTKLQVALPLLIQCASLALLVVWGHTPPPCVPKNATRSARCVLCAQKES